MAIKLGWASINILKYFTVIQFLLFSPPRHIQKMQTKHFYETIKAEFHFKSYFFLHLLQYEIYLLTLFLCPNVALLSSKFLSRMHLNAIFFCTSNVTFLWIGISKAQVIVFFTGLQKQSLFFH